jgi:F-type H+-transporting ATPase subunit gamma
MWAKTPAIADLIGGIRVMLDAYAQGQIDQLFLASNDFENTMTQAPTVRQLLPLDPADDEAYQHRWDYIYEPDARQLIEGLFCAICRVTGLSGGGRKRRL